MATNVDQKTTYDDTSSNRNNEGCFQCTLDPQSIPCAVPKLEGRLLGAYEHIINGQKIPVIGLTTDTGRIDVYLTDYYQKFVRELAERGQVVRDLPIRLYHLPQPPTTAEHKGKTRAVYHANSYTLAILEPDHLLNITDLSQAEYCSRQYLLNRLVTSPPNAATIRGNLIHYCFKELLKAHNRADYAQDETPLTTLQHHLNDALQQNTIELALANVSLAAIREEVMPHLASLAVWYQQQRSTLWDLSINSKPRRYQPKAQIEEAETSPIESEVSAETFLLAPEIGLKGRLDLYWQQVNHQRLLELKTGGASGDVPKTEHRRQVNGYSALLTVRRNKMKKAQAILLYSGTPAQAQGCRIDFTIRELQRVIETRNILILSHITGVPSAPPGPSRCTKCSLLTTCTTTSSMLHWSTPTPAPAQEAQPHAAPTSTPEPKTDRDQHIAASLLPRAYSDADNVFFAKFYDLLRIEGLESERQQALLWKTSPEERVERGTAINGLMRSASPRQSAQGEWSQAFHCDNTSELREGDEILLSDGDPITGTVVTGTIVHISAHEVTVWTREYLASPQTIDRSESNLVHLRTLKNLLRWLEADIHLRELVAGTVRPQFATKNGEKRVNIRASFNEAQNSAVEQALHMQDYLLIHGPPGTGKTSVIAEIVQRLCEQGQRIMLAAFTNQAVDNMLKRLDAEGFHDYVRLGHDRSVHAEVQDRLLTNLIAQPKQSEQIGNPQPTISEVLHKAQVVASTTATWSSEKYAAPALHGRAVYAAQLPLQFDVAIIDEASQLTIPAILGALRLAKRFILVGDDKQLPPVVLSQEAIEQGLADSLFSFLKRLDTDYRKKNSAEQSACVSLHAQYRMNKWISRYSSVVFYDEQLVAATSVKDRILEVPSQGAWLATEAPAITRAIEPKYPLVFLDVRPNTELEKLHYGELKSNDAEAQTVRAVVQGLLARGLDEKDIGIIAPFRAQVANVRRQLFSEDDASSWQGIAPDTLMSIDTVDRFQGGERKVIIMSFTVAHSQGNNGPLRDFLTNPNRLNVALTRAQRKLILVGCAHTLESLPYFDRLLTYCRSMKTVIPYNYVD